MQVVVSGSDDVWVRAGGLGNFSQFTIVSNQSSIIDSSPWWRAGRASSEHHTGMSSVGVNDHDSGLVHMPAGRGACMWTCACYAVQGRPALIRVESCFRHQAVLPWLQVTYATAHVA